MCAPLSLLPLQAAFRQPAESCGAPNPSPVKRWPILKRKSESRCSTEPAVFRSLPMQASLCLEKPALSSGVWINSKAVAKDLAGGLEPELRVAVDVMFPMEVLTCAVSDFQAKFRST